MSRRPLAILASIGMIVGAYLPVLFGIDDGFGGWSILGGAVGGFIGIWLGVVVAKRYS
jgi:hypothetical protein